MSYFLVLLSILVVLFVFYNIWSNIDASYAKDKIRRSADDIKLILGEGYRVIHTKEGNAEYPVYSIILTEPGFNHHEHGVPPRKMLSILKKIKNGKTTVAKEFIKLEEMNEAVKERVRKSKLI